MAKFGRNHPCWCGSRKKYKHCHYPRLPSNANERSNRSAAFDQAIREHQARERLRKLQQGEGRPLIEAKLGEVQFVALGNTLHYSKKWKTFPDFLFDYMVTVFGKEWGVVENARSDDELHPVLSWHRKVVALQKGASTSPGKLFETEMTGAVTCYLGLAYNLYLIKHNVELQDRLVERLKKASQFQGAYYELIVANCLIRAGFKLELEDESDTASKHCEFCAISPTTGKKYWVEAKMRSVNGILGKTRADGTNDGDPTAQISKHLREALKKPADGERLIFIDVNARSEPTNDEPSWSPRAYERLVDRERDLESDKRAYVFVTNFPYHRLTDDWRVQKAVLAFGLGIPNFAKAGMTTLSDWYRAKQEHLDAHRLLESMQSYPQIPESFDGEPLEMNSSQKSARLFVGQEYFFTAENSNGIAGIVRQVLVHEERSKATVVVETVGKSTSLIEVPLTKQEITSYRKYGSAYFGELEERSGHAKNEFELFEFFVKSYLNTPKERLLELAKSHPNYVVLEKLDQEDLVLAICESWVASIRAQEASSKSEGEA
jgi:SEC-C motif